VRALAAGVPLRPSRQRHPGGGRLGHRFRLSFRGSPGEVMSDWHPTPTSSRAGPGGRPRVRPRRVLRTGARIAARGRATPRRARCREGPGVSQGDLLALPGPGRRLAGWRLCRPGRRAPPPAASSPCFAGPLGLRVQGLLLETVNRDRWWASWSLQPRPHLRAAAASDTPARGRCRFSECGRDALAVDRHVSGRCREKPPQTVASLNENRAISADLRPAGVR
jgi:hypothetical protein